MSLSNPNPVPPVVVDSIRDIGVTAKQQLAATLASALIVASGRAHSVQEAINLMNDFAFALNPQPNNSRYSAWQQTAKINEPHK